MVESRGLLKDEIECTVKNDGTLVLNNVSNVKRFHFFGFFNHDRKTRYVPRILVTIPENASLSQGKFAFGAGNFLFKDTQFSVQEMHCELGAGNLELQTLNVGKLRMKVGMGNVKYTGIVDERLLLDCGMGAVNMNLKGNSNDYSYDCKVGLGDFNFDGDVKKGVHTVMADKMKKQHVSANVGMGSVKIMFN